MTPRSRQRRRHPLGAAMVRILRMPRGHHGYTVTQARVPMRDGVELLTDVYTPEGYVAGHGAHPHSLRPHRVIAHLTAGYFAAHGYHVVNQSCRGTFGSGGDFEPFSQEIADGADAVAWLRRQPWFGGRFALWGASYVGHAAWAVMMEPPPELVAAVIAISAHDGHWVAHGAGAFSLEESLGLMDGLGHLEGGAVRGILRGVTAGRRLTPAFEELPLVACARNGPRGQQHAVPGVAHGAGSRGSPVAAACGWVRRSSGSTSRSCCTTGWQDRFPDQMLEQYERLRRRGVEVGLTIGPWTHVEVVTKGAGVVMAETLDWLAEHLAGTGRRQRPSPVRIYVTGAQEWRHLPTWPPATHERVLYLQPHGGLDDERPTSAAGPTTFTYDPADPTPAVGGRIINPALGGYRDNRKLEERADVLTFTSPPLTEPLEVIGEPGRRGGAPDRQSLTPISSSACAKSARTGGPST